VRVRCVTLLCVALVASLPTSAAVAAGASIGGGPWSPPVSGPVARGFHPPATPFGAGHLGVDFATPPATPVRAAGDGIVVFAGRVGAGLHVVVRHPGDIRTSDSFLAAVSVVTGEAVERGGVLGTSGGTGPGHGAGVLHFAVRVSGSYVDPMLLFAPPDLAAVVHLAAPRGGAAATSEPVNRPGSVAVGERAALIDALRVDARPALAPPVWWDKVRAQPRSGSASPLSYRRASAKTSRPAPTSRRGSLAAVIAVAGPSLAGLAAARRLRRSRGP
jgi:murein DD-endopeptidase MepM/ murein hydrolase activator NlpD